MRCRLDPTMASLPSGRKTLDDHWYMRDFPPGTTLLARELKRQLRARRGYKNQDVRLQREARSYGRWLWHHEIWEELPEPGHA